MALGGTRTQGLPEMKVVPEVTPRRGSGLELPLSPPRMHSSSPLPGREENSSWQQRLSPQGKSEGHSLPQRLVILPLCPVLNPGDQ